MDVQRMSFEHDGHRFEITERQWAGSTSEPRIAWSVTMDGAPALDFEFYRTCVQRVFASPRPGHLPCTACHGGGQAGFAPVAANGTSWTEAEARRGFQAIQRLIVPGNAERSRWLLKPLHPDGGGSYTHNGVRRWQSRSDPEWQMLAAWVRGERTGNNCTT